MAVKFYGKIKVDKETNDIIIEHCEPHVSIKLKRIFTKIAVYQTAPYHFKNTPENGADLLWFMERYPLKISTKDRKALTRCKRVFTYRVNEAERLMLPNYKPVPVGLKDGNKARDYQVIAKDMTMLVNRMLLADELGLGKTLSAILVLLEPFTLPAAVVCQTHLPNHWKIRQIEKFTNLRVHIIKGTKPYDLPEADVYIFKYSCLHGWVNIFTEGLFKTAVFDEIQELRVPGSMKHQAGKVLSNSAERCIGLSATPIYNYGNEIFTVLNVINPGCLGSLDAFLREWCSSIGMNKWKVNDPKALGTYLREQSFMLRRTRSEVGRELPPINKIIIPVDSDEYEISKAQDLLTTLAIKITHGSFIERGEAARELDIMARYITGMAKARSVAAYVRLLLEAEERVVLAGWHRDVYDIWLKELAPFKPVMYTGSETPVQKENSFQTFIKGETNLFIISLRSGAGIDGLQEDCYNIVHGELDWSPKVHDQLNGRLDRDGNLDPNGQLRQVNAFYPVTTFGSDPVMMNLLGLKSSQQHGIVDPNLDPLEQYTDESRLKQLAQFFLNKQNKGLS